VRIAPQKFLEILRLECGEGGSTEVGVFAGGRLLLTYTAAAQRKGSIVCDPPTHPTRLCLAPTSAALLNIRLILIFAAFVVTSRVYVI